MRRAAGALIVVLVFGGASAARGEEPAPVPAAVVPVSAADRCVWERYEYLRLLAAERMRSAALEARVQALEYEKQTIAEYAAVSARFREQYHVGVEELTYSDGVFRRRPTPPAAAAAPTPGERK